MFPTIRIPDGFVFFRKAPGVARGLLEAADRLEADRKMGVRTVSGGYHATVEIAEEYQKTLPEATGLEGDATELVAEPVVESSDEAESPDGTPVEVLTEPGLDESWTVAQIEEWAARQEPPIVFPSEATTKAKKIQFINKPAQADDQVEE